MDLSLLPADTAVLGPPGVSRNAPIGVFDSGIGGLSVLRALQRELPHERFVYFADNGHAPYGERGDAFVTERTLAVADRLRGDHGIKALVVACNTATTAAIHLLRAAHPGLAVVGVEPAVKPALLASRTGRIGVIGTRGTLGSEKFRQLLAPLQSQAHFTVQPCDGLAAAIERSALGDDAGPSAIEIRALCARYTGAMSPFGTEKDAIDTLVLGCTHYVFAAEALRACTGPDVHFLETGEPVARQTRRLLTAQDRLCDGTADTSAHPAALTLLSSGDLPLLRAAAQRWLD